MNDSLDPILQQEEQRKLRVQLIWRLAIAVVLVAGVLGILAWLEQEKESKPQITMSEPHTVHANASTPIASEVISASAPISLAQASTPNTFASEVHNAQPIAEQNESTIQTTPAILSSHPKTEPDTQPATPATMSISKPSLPVIAHPTAPSQPAEPARSSISQRLAPFPAEQAFAPPQKTATQQPLPIASRFPQPVTSPNGFIVQAGVFLHSANAEKLLKQVENAGIPAYLETRVQIGPFNNKAEAEVAIKKLQKMGIEPVLKIN